MRIPKPPSEVYLLKRYGPEGSERLGGMSDLSFVGKQASCFCGVLRHVLRTRLAVLHVAVLPPKSTRPKIDLAQALLLALRVFG